MKRYHVERQTCTEGKQCESAGETEAPSSCQGMAEATRGWESGRDDCFPKSSEGTSLENLLVSDETPDLQDNEFLLGSLWSFAMALQQVIDLGKPARQKCALKTVRKREQGYKMMGDRS